MTARSRYLVVAVMTLMAAGCATQEKFLDSRQAQAVQTAARGRTVHDAGAAHPGALRRRPGLFRGLRPG